MLLVVNWTTRVVSEENPEGAIAAYVDGFTDGYAHGREQNDLTIYEERNGEWIQVYPLLPRWPDKD